MLNRTLFAKEIHERLFSRLMKISLYMWRCYAYFIKSEAGIKSTLRDAAIAENISKIGMPIGPNLAWARSSDNVLEAAIRTICIVCEFEQAKMENSVFFAVWGKILKNRFGGSFCMLNRNGYCPMAIGHGSY